MKEVGTVAKISRTGFATVRFPRKTACEHCNMCLKPKDEMYVQLRLKNSVGAKEGDKVEVTMGDRAVLTASFLVYIMPLIPMAIVLGTTYRVSLALAYGLAAATLILGFVAVALIDRKIREKAEFIPKIPRIVPEDESNPDEQASRLSDNDGEDADGIGTEDKC